MEEVPRPGEPQKYHLYKKNLDTFNGKFPKWFFGHNSGPKASQNIKINGKWSSRRARSDFIGPGAPKRPENQMDFLEVSTFPNLKISKIFQVSQAVWAPHAPSSLGWSAAASF